MKICPRCNQPTVDIASICPRCDHEFKEADIDDFPTRRRAAPDRKGLAYAPFAQLSLEVWAYLALFSIVVSLIIATVSVFQGEWSRAFLGLIGAWGNFALYALLRRVADSD